MVTAAELADAIGALHLSRFHIAQWLCAGVLVFIANGAVGASLPWIELDLRARLELTPLAESLILVAAPFGAFVGALASGALSDRFGRRRILLLALTILGAAHASIGVAPSPGALVAPRTQPWRWAIAEQMASPMPIPAYFSRPCKRRNGSNTWAWWLMSKPIPLSRTWIRRGRPSGSRVTRTRTTGRLPAA